MKIYLEWAAAVFGVIAGTLWAFASFQKVQFNPNETDAAGFQPAAITEKQGKREIDILKTAAAQTKWNGRAALAASIAAMCQAIFLML